MNCRMKIFFHFVLSFDNDQSCLHLGEAAVDIVNNRKNGRPFELGAVTMDLLLHRSRDSDRRCCSMQPLPTRSKLMHRETRRTGEAENIRPWQMAARSGANRQLYFQGR